MVVVLKLQVAKKNNDEKPGTHGCQSRFKKWLSYLINLFL